MICEPAETSSVSEAIERRQSVRAFLDQPVDPGLIRDILERSGRAPSNGNLQPWQVHVATGATLKRIGQQVRAHLAEGRHNDGPPSPVYPRGLWEPFRSRRHDAGTERYAALGFHDKDPAGLALLTKLNAACFGAPAALFFYLEDRMERHQWCDLGMFMQNIMLLAVERGLATCPQAFWTNWAGVLRDSLEVAPNMVLVAGMSIGRPDPDAPLNAYRTARAPAEDWLTLHD